MKPGNTNRFIYYYFVGRLYPSVYSQGMKGTKELQGRIVCIETKDTTAGGAAMIDLPEKCIQSYAQNVDKKRKFRSSQMEQDQYTAGIASRAENPAEAEVEVDMAAAAAAEAATIVHPARCTLSPVRNVDRKPRFRSNLMVRDQCTVRIVSGRIGRPATTRQDTRQFQTNI